LIGKLIYTEILSESKLIYFKFRDSRISMLHCLITQSYKLRIIFTLSHENIIKMYGFFRDEDKIVYVLEYAAGGEVYAELLSQPNSRFSNQRLVVHLLLVHL